LTKPAFQKIKERAARSGIAVDNHFLVASVHRRAKALVCYGANMRNVFSLADVVLV
jgi:hypothetical protein